jgi:iron complex outermembrane receptor protein
VVNVIDQSIPTRPVEGLNGHAIASASSVDQGREGALDLTAGAGPFAVRGSVSARDTEEYDTPIGKVANSWTKSRTYAGGAAVVGGAGFAGISVKRVENDYGLLPEEAGEAGGRIEMTQTRIESRGEAKVQWGPIDRLDYAVQHSDYSHTEFEADGEAGTRFESKGYEARGEAHHANDAVFGGALTGAFGLQTNDVDLEAIGEEAFNPPTTTRKGGVFVVERWDRARWGLEAGARVERTEIENRGSGVERSFDGASGSLGVFLRPAQGWFTGVTVARTERAPSAVELFADGPHIATETFEIGSDRLNSETANSIEATVRFAGNDRNAEFNLYRVEFSDYIGLVNRGDVFFEADGLDGFATSPDDPAIPADASILPVFNYVQKDATFTGGEISVSSKLADIGAFTLRGRASLDYVRAEFASGGAIPRIPPRTGRLGLSLENASWTFSVEGVDVARQSRTATFESETPGYQMLNAGIAWRPSGEESAFAIRLDGRNLTDELARVHSSFLKDKAPLQGRSVRLALTANF